MLIQTRKQFEAARTALLLADVIAVDTETTGLYFHKGDKIIGISTYCALQGQEDYFLGCYFPWRHSPKTMDLFTLSENLPMEWLQELRPALEREDITLLFHNAKFDLKMLRQEGINCRAPFYDTMVMSHMIDENGVHSLKGLGAERWGEDIRTEEKLTKKLVQKKGGWDRTSAEEMRKYAVKDAELTFELWREFLTELDSQELTPLWPREEQFVRCLLELEWEGIELDAELAKRLSSQAVARMREIEDELGFDPLRLDVLASKLFLAPPEGLGLPIGPLSNTSSQTWPGGIPSMPEEYLSQLKHPVVSNVLEYRGLVKANSTWYAGFQQKASSQGRLHPSYNTAEKKEKWGTRTTRLSSSYPNIQQMPRNVTDFPARKLLQPPEGMTLFEFDYSQIELRLAVCYAYDDVPVMVEALQIGADPHQITADAIGVSRQTAKHAMYTTLYGGGAPTLVETLKRLEWQTTGRLIEVSEEEARAVLVPFHQLHPGFKKKLREAERVARKTGYVKLWTGRRRHFVEQWEFHKAFNSVIQGGAAEIMKDTMLSFFRERDSKPYRMALQIHDSLWFEVPVENQDKWCREITETMEWPTSKFPIPFPVDTKLLRERCAS